MDIVERVDNFLAHYASENYDPAKAHDYYLKNRELKGRTSTKGMSDTQKEAWSYAKYKIGNDKKAELESTANAQKARLDEIRKRAEETRDRIREKLESLLDSLKVKPPEWIEADPVPEPTFMPIPTNASPKVKAFLRKQNGLRMQAYGRDLDKAESAAQVKRDAANEEYAKAREAASETSAKARLESRAEREKVGTDLKAAVSNARAAYDDAKKQLVAKYEAKKDTELQNIRTQLPSAPPPVKKASTGKKRSTKKEGEPSK